MIRVLIIAVAFPLTLKAQSDTTVIPDSVRIVRWMDIKQGMASIEDKVTVSKYKEYYQILEYIFRFAIANQKPKTESK